MATVENFEFPNELQYEMREHLWLRNDGDHFVVGLDSVSIAALGNVVHVEIADVGTAVSQGDDLGSLEAEKMVSSIIAPISGKIVERNEETIAAPGTIMDDPYGDGWLFAIKPDPNDEGGDLVEGAAAIQDWAETELARYTDNGWV
jgi:glycine cleavage system H protein